MGLYWKEMLGQYIRGPDGVFYRCTKLFADSLLLEEVDESSAYIDEETRLLTMWLVKGGREKCIYPDAINHSYVWIHKHHPFWSRMRSQGVYASSPTQEIMTRSAVLTQAFAAESEPYLIDPAHWEAAGAPSEAIEIARQKSVMGYPSGIAHHSEAGWMVLVTGGQGPAIVWCSTEFPNHRQKR